MPVFEIGTTTLSSPPGCSVHGIFQARILDMGCHFLLQGIFPTQESNLGLLHCRQTLYRLSYKGSPVVFPVVMYGLWELDHKEGWMPKNWYFWAVVLKKTLDSPLDCKEIKPVNPKGNQSWIFTTGTDAEAEAPIFWPPDAKSQLIRKDSDAGKEWRQGQKGMTEDEMVGWHHWLNGHEFEQTLGDGEGQGSLACCSPCGCKESNTT